jgi:hypothetical protein
LNNVWASVSAARTTVMPAATQAQQTNTRITRRSVITLSQ